MTWSRLVKEKGMERDLETIRNPLRRHSFQARQDLLQSHRVEAESAIREVEFVATWHYGVFRGVGEALA